MVLEAWRIGSWGLGVRLWEFGIHIPFEPFNLSTFQLPMAYLGSAARDVSVSTCGVAAIIQPDGSFPALAGIER